MEAKDVAPLGRGVRPSHPRHPLCEGLLHHHVIQAQIAILSQPLLPADQPYDQPLRGPGQGPQQSVEGIVCASRQELRHVQRGLALLQKDEPAHVQDHQLHPSARPPSTYSEPGERLVDLLPEGSSASIQPGHHEGPPLPDGCFVLPHIAFVRRCPKSFLSPLRASA